MLLGRGPVDLLRQDSLSTARDAFHGGARLPERRRQATHHGRIDPRLSGLAILGLARREDIMSRMTLIERNLATAPSSSRSSLTLFSALLALCAAAALLV